MADYSDIVTAAQAVVGPNTSAADLAQIAQLQPRLWSQIAAHPNVYPGLLAWLEANGGVAKQPIVQQAATTQQAVPPYAAVQPGQGSFAYQGAYARPAVGAPVARRSKRPLVIGIVAVVVVAAIAATLLIWKPWQKSVSGPTLTVDQFVTMANNDPDMFVQSDSPLTAQDVQQGVSEAQQPGNWDQCNACDQSMSNVIGFINAEDAFTFLFDSKDDANSLAIAWADYMKSAIAANSDSSGQSLALQSQLSTSGGVWLLTVTNQAGQAGKVMSQYGNVIRLVNLSCTSASDCSSQAQTVAAAFKQDIDQAAKS